MLLFTTFPAAMPSVLTMFASLPDPTSLLVIGLGLAGVGLVGTRKATTDRRK